jgi:SAM-dependent methyltransferase
VGADLERLRATWDAIGRGEDTLGYILGYPEHPHPRLEDFLASGEREIERTLAAAEPLGLPLRRGAALDFGCGVGRLTQALGERFESAVGVDIAPAMIAAAERLNRHGVRCRYALVEDDSLALFADASFDFVYSNIVLQHIRPEYARRYVAELARVLRPGGLLVFQVPHDRDPVPRLARNAVLAEIEPAVRELELPAGATRSIRARVRNTGAGVWPGREGAQRIFLGNHWLSPDGALLQLDDGRAPLERDVAPGEEIELDLRVTAPAAPGEYLLELDLVQEGISWFAQRRKLSRRRTRAPRVPARVVRSRAAEEEPAEELRMEMHAIPRGEVEKILAASGARLVEVAQDDAAGAGWVSLRYTATRDA